MYNTVLVSELCFWAIQLLKCVFPPLFCPVNCKQERGGGGGGGCVSELACGLELFLVQFIVVEAVASSFNTRLVSFSLITVPSSTDPFI